MPAKHIVFLAVVPPFTRRMPRFPSLPFSCAVVFFFSLRLLHVFSVCPVFVLSGLWELFLVFALCLRDSLISLACSLKSQRVGFLPAIVQDPSNARFSSYSCLPASHIHTQVIAFPVPFQIGLGSKGRVWDDDWRSERGRGE